MISWKRLLYGSLFLCSIQRSLAIVYVLMSSSRMGQFTVISSISSILSPIATSTFAHGPLHLAMISWKRLLYGSSFLCSIQKSSAFVYVLMSSSRMGLLTAISIISSILAPIATSTFAHGPLHSAMISWKRLLYGSSFLCSIQRSYAVVYVLMSSNRTGL